MFPKNQIPKDYDIPCYGIALKGDVSHLFGINDKSNDVMYTLGLAMPLGKKYTEKIVAKEPVVALVPVVDGDDDTKEERAGNRRVTGLINQ